MNKKEVERFLVFIYEGGVGLPPHLQRQIHSKKLLGPDQKMLPFPVDPAETLPAASKALPTERLLFMYS